MTPSSTSDWGLEGICECPQSQIRRETGIVSAETPSLKSKWGHARTTHLFHPRSETSGIRECPPVKEQVV